MNHTDDGKDFAAVTKMKTQDIEPFIRASKDTRDIEDYLKSKHDLKYNLAQVRYNFDPHFYRLESIDFNVLVKALSDKYGLHFRVPDIVKMAMQASDPDPTLPSPNERMKEVMDSSAGLVFLDGLLAYQDKGSDIQRVVRIIHVHSQNLTVTVDGTTREAEFIAERISLDLQRAQGMQPTKEGFTEKVAGKRFMCTTQLRLGVPVTKLLSRSMNSFLSDSVANDLGWRMGMQTVRPFMKGANDFDIAVAFHEMQFSIGVFDKQSGHQYDANLSISTTDRNFHGSDFVSVTSQLNTDDHLALLRALVRGLTGK